MAKKKDNTLLYAGIAAAALLLFKKKDSGMAGVGAATQSSVLITGDFLTVKHIAYRLESLTNYIDKQEESGSNDGLYKIVAFTYPSYKTAKEALKEVIDDMYNRDYIIKSMNRKDSEFSIRDLRNESKRAYLSIVKGGVRL